MSEVLLQLRNASFAYTPASPVIAGLSIEVARGSFLGLIGPNGAGKSTLLHLLSGWLRPTAGVAELHGRPLTAWSRLELARKMAVVPQREENIFDFTVAEMVAMGRYAHHRGSFSIETPEDHDAVTRALSAVELTCYAHRAASQLSGGEYQRLLVARALAQETPILLLDEPTASLDLHHQRLLFSLLQRLNREQGKTIVAVSHDLNLAAMYCHELALLHGGRLIHRGIPQHVLDKERLQVVYRVPLAVQTGADGIPHVVLQR